MLGCSSKGKLDYYKRNSRLWFAGLQFKNVREPHHELGRVELLHVICSPNPQYQRFSRDCFKIELFMRTEAIEDELELFSCSIELFQMTRGKAATRN